MGSLRPKGDSCVSPLEALGWTEAAGERGPLMPKSGSQAWAGGVCPVAWVSLWDEGPWGLGSESSKAGKLE